MRLTRVYVDSPLAAGELVEMQGSAANHIARVLRLRLGNELTVFNGRGGEFGAAIESLRRNSVLVRVGEQRPVERESPLQLTLAQGISRGERMDWIVQKATELGTARIVPIFAQRSVVRLDAAQAGRKLQHWQAIAIASCEQSGRNRLPDIELPLGIHEFLLASAQPRQRQAQHSTHRHPSTAPANSLAAPGAAMLAAPRASAPIATRVLLSPAGKLLIDDLEDLLTGITVLIGPEGGLTDSEQQAAIGSGFRPVRIGPRVLRTETAAIAALTILQQKFGDL